MKSQQKIACIGVLEELQTEYQRGNRNKAFAILCDIVAEILRAETNDT
ncbi:MAG: hypothetical protein ACM3UL_00230 [Ignavibacteria bacterium]